jgi:hypothetical protein
MVAGFGLASSLFLTREHLAVGALVALVWLVIREGRRDG